MMARQPCSVDCGEDVGPLSWQPERGQDRHEVAHCELTADRRDHQGEHQPRPCPEPGEQGQEDGHDRRLDDESRGHRHVLPHEKLTGVVGRTNR